MSMIPKIMEMTQKMKRLDSESKLALQEFEVGAESNDTERMNSARLKLHEYTDMRLDMICEVNRMKDQSMEELFKKLGTGKP